jgi:tetratricopeptide (TPR) repeat protein
VKRLPLGIWTASCVAVLAYALFFRGRSEDVFAIGIIILTFPSGLIVLGAFHLLSTMGVDLHSDPYSRIRILLPDGVNGVLILAWLLFVLAGYWQWFMLVPAVRSRLKRRASGSDGSGALPPLPLPSWTVVWRTSVIAAVIAGAGFGLYQYQQYAEENDRIARKEADREFDEQLAREAREAWAARTQVEQVRAAQQARGKGNRALEEERAGEAIPEYSRAINLYPRYAAAYVSRGNAYLALNDPERAIADYKLAIENDPGYAQAFLARGTVYWLYGDLTAAERDYRTLVSLESTKFHLNRLATVLYEQNKARDVEAIYQAAYRQDTSRQWALEAWLSAYGGIHGDDALMRRIEELEAGGVSDAILFLKGRTLLVLKRPFEAIPVLKKVLEGDPAKVPTEAAAYLADAYRATGDRKSCKQQLEDYAKRMGRSSEVLDLSVCD